MSVTNIVQRGYGQNSSIHDIVTRGYQTSIANTKQATIFSFATFKGKPRNQMFQRGVFYHRSYSPNVTEDKIKAAILILSGRISRLEAKSRKIDELEVIWKRLYSYIKDNRRDIKQIERTK